MKNAIPRAFLALAFVTSFQVRAEEKSEAQTQSNQPQPQTQAQGQEHASVPAALAPNAATASAAPIAPPKPVVPVVTPPPLGSSSAAFIPGALVSVDPNQVIEGPQLPNYAEELKRVFPSADSFRVSDLLPLQSGGTSFVGLVARLLGDGPDRNLEGLRTRRYMYQALEKDKPVGIVHGSSINVGNSSVDVFVFYSSGGTIREVKVLQASENLTRELASYLKQFEGFTTEDFEMIRGRRHRIKSKGAFFAKVHKPGSGSLRNSFDRIIRAVRFNAAFMDVAYFITQHPDLADKALQEFPDEVQVTTGIPQSGPEAFARAQAQKANRSPASNAGEESDE